MNPYLAALFLPFVLLMACSEDEKLAEKQNKHSSDSVQSVVEKIPAVSEDTFSKEYLLGRFEADQHPDFVRIEDTWSAGSGRGAYLQKDTYAAFVKMAQAAKADGIQLTIISATRNFFRQKEIWEAKWNGKRLVEGQLLPKTIPDPEQRALFILRYSSMPGTSRHHWGTDFDLNDLNNSYFESGKGKAEYDWLLTHASDYGFCQPYTPKGPERPHGYEEEKWHWSYFPLSAKLTAAYAAQIGPNDINGFDGAGTAQGIDVIRHYVLGINCQMDK